MCRRGWDISNMFNSTGWTELYTCTGTRRVDNIDYVVHQSWNVNTHTILDYGDV